MRKPFAYFVLTILTAMPVSIWGQAAAPPTDVPSPFPVPTFTIHFDRGEELPIDAPAIVLPYECTGDGTVFLNALKPPDPTKSSEPSSQLSSVTPSREVHVFRLDQVPELYDVRQIDHYAFDSGVVFLVKAAQDNKQVLKSVTTQDGNSGHLSENTAEHHLYVVTFDREGKYKDTSQLDDSFPITHLAAFSSGTLLAYGYDRLNHSPRIALLKDDGSFVKSVEVPAGNLPESAMGPSNSNNQVSFSAVAPVQFVPSGSKIIAVQNKTDFPLLEVTEGGEVRVIRPKLPEGVQIKSMIASDANLFALATDKRNDAIYELSPQNGTVLKQFHIENQRDLANVACVHDGKFLSFERSQGKTIPLSGSMTGH